MRRRSRRTFRGKSRQWRANTWAYYPVGDIENESGLFQCREEIPPGNQAFYPILVDQNFNPGANNPPFAQERIVCLRTLGEIDFIYSAALTGQVPSQIRWAVALLDEEAVADVTYLFPSLYSLDFHANERVLLTGIAKWHGVNPQDEGTGPIPSRIGARIEWDQKLGTRLETGTTLWLVIEVQYCLDANPDQAILSPWALGFTRALWRT